MSSYNPSAPNTIGVEWPVLTEGLTALDSATRNAAPRIVAGATETIDALMLPHRWTGPSAGYGRLWTDVYDMSASPVVENVTELTYSPNETKASSDVTKSDWFTTSNLWNVIDDTDDDPRPEYTDYIINTDVGGAGTARFQFGTAAIPNTWRILYVKFELRCKGYPWSWQQPYVDLEWWDNATYLGRLWRIPPPQDWRWRTYTSPAFFFDPMNEGCWLQPEIANLDVNTSRNVGLTLAYACAVSRLTMKVGVITENRAAVGISAKVTAPPSGLQTNMPIQFKSPLNADNWSKTSGKTYALVTRRLEDPFAADPTLTPQIAHVTSSDANPTVDGDGYSFELADQSGRVTAYTDPSTPTFAAVLATSAGAQSADSQPYHDLIGATVYNGHAVRQGIADATVQDYKRVRALIGIATDPTADLTISVHRLSDNVQFGGNGTLTVADLADSSVATRVGTFDYSGVSFVVYSVLVELATAATLAAATSYYVQLASTTGSSVPWLVMGLDAAASHSYTGNQTYGGATQQGYLSGSPEPTTDYMLNISSVPSALAGFVGSVLSSALPDNGGSACDPGVLYYAHLNWTSSALGAAFVRYEVARTYDNGVTWEDIAWITDEADSDFDDYELRRGVDTKYRVRVVRSDYASSEWSTLAAAVNAPTSPGALLFVSNSDPGLSTGYVLIGPRQDYEFLGAAEVVFMRMHNRDYQAAFRPLEDRGVRWSFSVIVYVADTPAAAPPDGEGFSAFDTLRAIAEADVPYVALLTPDGDVLYGAIQVPRGTRTEPAQYYVASCTFTQTQAAPSIVTV